MRRLANRLRTKDAFVEVPLDEIGIYMYAGTVHGNNVARRKRKLRQGHMRAQNKTDIKEGIRNIRISNTYMINTPSSTIST